MLLLTGGLMTVIGAMLTEWLITILLMASSLWRDDHCQLVDDGWASTVGPYPSYQGEWRYPWADVLWARQNGYAARGGITDDTRLHIEPVAPAQITSLNGGTFRPGLRVRVWTCDPQQ